jgi:Family of unknown function (DUF6492)/Nucleotide-diphospho-sugar transferase
MAQKSTDRPVIITCVNAGYVEMGRNLMESFRRNAPGYRVVCYALDEEASAGMEGEIIPFFKGTGKEFLNYNEGGFCDLMRVKMEAIAHALRGYGWIHFLDADCACLREPEGIWDKRKAYVFQKDCPCDEEGCSGQDNAHCWLCMGNFTIRDCKASWELLGRIGDLMGSHPEKNEQECLQVILKEGKTAPSYPVDLMPNGDSIKKGIGERAVFVHANHVKGKADKIDLLRKCGAWYGKPVVDVMIRSYRNDFPWLGHCLKSLHERLAGWRAVTVCVPNEDLWGVQALTLEKVHGIAESGDGYMHQQVTKLHAFLYSNADFILHVDSDCIFTRPCSVEEMIHKGKAMVLREENVNSPWSIIAARQLGWQDSGEYMRRMPILYPRWAYTAFKAWMESHTGMGLEAFIMSRPNREFSEFNTIGQWLYRFHSDEIEWKHPSEMEPMCKQFWSWDGLAAHEEEVKRLVFGPFV